MAVGLDGVGFFGGGAVESVLGAAAGMDVDHVGGAVFQDVDRAQDVGLVGEADVVLFAVGPVGGQVEDGLWLDFGEDILDGGVGEDIAMEDILGGYV